MEDKKASLIVAFISLACVILLFVAGTGLYQKQKTLERKITDMTLTYKYPGPSDFQYLQGTVDQYNQRLSAVEQNRRSSEQRQFTYEERYLLDDLVQERMRQQNSVLVNGALRMRAERSRVFSFDIPAGVYKDFSDLLYTFHGDNSTGYYYTDDFSLYNSAHETLAVHTEADDGSLSQINLSAEYGRDCAVGYSEDTQGASTIFKKYLIEEKGERKESLKNIDFCKYITAHKNIRAAIQDTDKDNLLSPIFPKSSSTTVNWIGYTFDMDAFLHDTDADESDFFFPADRLFAAVGSWKDQDGAPRIFYRLVNINWTPNPISDYDFRTETKEFQKRVLNQLDATIQSIANSMIVLPFCDDFFGRCTY